MELFVAVISGLIAALVLWWKSSSKAKQPPGPWGLPLFGYLPFLTSKPHLTFMKLAKKYGNVFSLRLGSVNVLILNDFQSTKDAFLQDAFIARPDGPFDQNEETKETGAFFGLAWKGHRGRCLHLLRDVGLGKTKMEEHIQEEINELLENFERNVGEPFCLRPLLAASTSNIIALLLFGRRVKYDDPMLQKLTRMIYENAMAGKQTTWILFYPWLIKLFTILGFGPVVKFAEPNVFIRNYVMNEINEHEKMFSPDNIRDFVDGYLLAIQKRTNDPTFNKAVLQDVAGFFFAAGSLTIRQSVEFLILAAASDRIAQQRIFEEIRNVIGQDRPPVWLDHKKMPYTYAFIMEMQRWRTIVPLNFLRYTVSDTIVNGYFIPKHTRVISNHWAIHHDSEYWGPDADEFRPERFLTEDGKEVKKIEHYIPFSIGKRACPGEALAKVEIFLYFISILQKFHVKMASGKTADFEGVFGIGLDPKAQDVILSNRI